MQIIQSGIQNLSLVSHWIDIRILPIPTLMTVQYVPTTHYMYLNNTVHMYKQHFTALAIICNLEKTTLRYPGNIYNSTTARAFGICTFHVGFPIPLHHPVKTSRIEQVMPPYMA